MKILRTIVCILTGLLAGTVAWSAALDPRAQTLKEQLNLTEPQTQEIDKLFKETRAKQKVLRNEMQELYQKQQEQLNAIFTPEQAKKYREQEESPTVPPRGEAAQPSGAEPPPPPSK